MSNVAGNRISLLYVEDEQGTRETLTKIISHRYPELDIFVCRDGREGLESFRQYHQQIVLTDINMPLTNGILMASEVRKISRGTEIIALTAFAHTDYLLQAIEIGISHYILKPVDVKQIFKVLDKTIAFIRSEQELARQNKIIHELNKELSQKKIELETANLELESFNYTVAHDLRTPMVAISGFAQILLEKYDSTPAEVCKEYLQIINKEIIRISSLIDILLKFSMYSRKNVTKSITDLSGIANEISADLISQDPGRKVDFDIEEEVKCFADPNLMRVVLENLLGNAWKYTGNKQRARIEFGTVSKEEDLLFFVRDNGDGFDPEEAKNLFTPFHRLESAEKIEGFGIGLATVERIIQRHGGRVWAEGAKGEGAVFFFTL